MIVQKYPLECEVIVPAAPPQDPCRELVLHRPQQSAPLNTQHALAVTEPTEPQQADTRPVSQPNSQTL